MVFTVELILIPSRSESFLITSKKTLSMLKVIVVFFPGRTALPLLAGRFCFLNNPPHNRYVVDPYLSRYDICIEKIIPIGGSESR